ncbi:flavodoxin domain-containing protein [uncultured Methanobrevibacter sp.]|uniref:flavodoxin domain-containing protein n=1 Tax=uncultured Methanobrevibacter sp. TaxID=253161 RepID=UPI00261D3740
MKTAIIYASKRGTTRKVAKYMVERLDCEAITIPVAKSKSTCLLKYDFIIIAGSIHYGRIQSEIKSFVNKNRMTLKGINFGLYIVCINDDKSDQYLEKAFSREILDAAYIYDSFGGEVNLNEGDLITKHIIRSKLDDFKKERSEAPKINWEKVDAYIDKINQNIVKNKKKHE